MTKPFVCWGSHVLSRHKGIWRILNFALLADAIADKDSSLLETGHLKLTSFTSGEMGSEEKRSLVL